MVGLFQGTALISLGSLFSRQPAPLLGLDISSSSVKLVELGRDKEGNLVLERCAIEPLERGWITDGNVEKFDEVAEAVRRWSRKAAPRPKMWPWRCLRRRSLPRKSFCPAA
jgi:type IV pilus assembly protein PilM